MNSAIAGGHELTAQAAQDILQAGGNAVDAAIAAFLMTWVAEPCMSSAGGGAFAMVCMDGKTPVLLDFFCQTPGYKRPLAEIDFFPVTIDFGDEQEVFHVGKGSSAVPGAVAGVFALHERFGTIPMRELAQPAIEASKQGVVVNDFQHFDFDLVSPILKLDKRGEEVFFPNGKVPDVGERVHLSQMADFLEVLAVEGRDFFYRGEVAKRIVQDYESGGGFLTMEDFANYKVIARKPLQFPYHGKMVYTNPEPSIGGTIIALTMAQFGEKLVRAHYLSADHIRHLHDVFDKVDQLGKLPEDLFRAVRQWQQKTWGSTTHFNVADKDGNAVSLSTTIGEGCGYFVPGTDILMNNTLGEAVLLPRGFHSWRENVRLSSMMSPTIVLNEAHHPEIVLGTGGASRIAFAISQVLHLLIDHKLLVQEAVNAPRVHLEHGVLQVEAGFDDAPKPDQLRHELKVWLQQSLFFGGVHALQRISDQWTAGGDDRRDGFAKVISQ